MVIRYSFIHLYLARYLNWFLVEKEGFTHNIAQRKMYTKNVLCCRAASAGTNRSSSIDHNRSVECKQVVREEGTVCLMITNKIFMKNKFIL